VRLDGEGNFVYQHAKWIIIYNRDYSELRKRDKCDKFADLPDVDTDAVNIKRGIKGLGARDEDIVMYANVQKSEMMNMFKDLNSEVYQRHKTTGENTLVFVYYAGHGIMNCTVEALVNNNDPGNLKFRFPIEKMMRICGTNPGTFVLGVLDCCRENFATRGGGGAEEDDEEDYSNVFITYGCAPGGTVDARSTIAVKYFEKLREFARPDGTVLVPGKMITWRNPGNGGEHFSKHSNDLKLNITNFTGDVQNTAANANNAMAAQMEQERLQHQQEMQRLRQQMEMQQMQAQLAQQQAAAAQAQAEAEAKKRAQEQAAAKQAAAQQAAAQQAAAQQRAAAQPPPQPAG